MTSDDTAPPVLFRASHDAEKDETSTAVDSGDDAMSRLRNPFDAKPANEAPTGDRPRRPKSA